MRFRILLMIAVCTVCIFLSCHRKSVPVIAERTTQPVPPVTQPVNTAIAEMEAGRVIYTTRCARCHEIKPVEKWTVEQWQPILKSMIRKSKLDSVESGQVSLYVNTHAKK